MDLRHGLSRWGVGLVLTVAAVLAFSASTFAQTKTVSARAAALRCHVILGFGQVTLPGIGTVDLLDHLTASGKGIEQFEASTFDTDDDSGTVDDDPPGTDDDEPETVLQLSTLEHAACGITRKETKFSADGLAVFQGQERYAMALTFRFFGGHTYLSLFLVKPGFKSLRVTNAELAPSCSKEVTAPCSKEIIL